MFGISLKTAVSPENVTALIGNAVCLEGLIGFLQTLSPLPAGDTRMRCFCSREIRAFAQNSFGIATAYPRPAVKYQAVFAN